MDTLIIQIKKYIKFFLKYKSLFVIFLLITIFITLNFFNPNIIHILSDIRVPNNLRKSRKLTSADNKTYIKNNEYNDFDEMNFLLNSNLTLIEGMNTNLSEILIYYEFIDNISHTYYGSWKNLSVEKNTFTYNTGNGDIDFYEESKENF